MTHSGEAGNNYVRGARGKPESVNQDNIVDAWFINEGKTVG